MKKLGLYFHIPFCNSKCLYCDFDSKVSNYEEKKRYINALIKEIDIANKKYNLDEYIIDTIFIGGGTPTSLEENLLEKLLRKIEESFNLSEDIEYTIEMNPNSVSKEKIDIIKKYKINRISLGLQSTNEIELKSLGRTHSYDEFEYAYNLLRENGFKNINVDLMIGIPNQSFKSYKDSLNKIISISPEHISAYMLIVEDNTEFGKMYDEGNLIIDDDLTLKLYEYTVDFLNKNGYIQYEISNFAKKGYECRHNIRYWKVEDYLGFGQSAHSLFNSKRFSNMSYDYINNIEYGRFAIENIDEHTQKDEYEEWIFLKLRMNKGINIDELDKKFNINFREKYNEKLKELYDKNLINNYDENLSLTLKGIEISNSIFLEFID